jgi:hypothetical protein
MPSDERALVATAAPHALPSEEEMLAWFDAEVRLMSHRPTPNCTYLSHFRLSEQRLALLPELRARVMGEYAGLLGFLHDPPLSTDPGGFRCSVEAAPDPGDPSYTVYTFRVAPL